MEEIFISDSPEATEDFGKKLAESLTPGLIILHGNLGAGKTKLTSGILQGLGAEGPYQSPTFMLVKEYHLDKTTPSGISRVYHGDAYRLQESDFETLGFQSWLEDPEGLVILEWPEKVGKNLPEEKREIHIESLSDAERKIIYKSI